ncbi:hypothetical protein [Cupriavidus gilardii]|uniref:hypothetical protein n=1 Tax=Cupriavidus gilardii TaxID=82541 RepID=UPI001572CECD|nr:hypothetical protein [Cupriavidus gilardii]NSX04793.1 hypothetical protein [Cupriavidus gilardii]
MLDKLEPIESPDGKFHDGNPVDGTLGTIVKALWLNAVQDAVRSVQGELINLITGLGGQIDPAKEDQIKTLLANALAKKANLESPELTGTPKAPTAAVESNSTAIANTEHVFKKLLRFGIGGGLATAAQFADLIASNDANDANITGIYTLVGTKNVPNGTSVMLHIERRFGAGVTAVQLSANAENLVFRTRVAAAWNTWRTVADVEGAANKVNRTGDTMTGDLLIAPSAAGTYGQIALKTTNGGRAWLRGGNSGFEMVNNAYQLIVMSFYDDGGLAIRGDLRTGKDNANNFVLATQSGTMELCRPEGAFVDFKRYANQDFEWRLVEAGDGSSMVLMTPGVEVFRFQGDGDIHCAGRGWIWGSIGSLNTAVGNLNGAMAGKAPLSVMQNNGVGSYRLDNSANNPPVGPGSWEDRGTVNAGGGMLVRLLCRIA